MRGKSNIIKGKGGIMSDIKNQRMGLIKKLFPDQFPQIWCPPLTHYDQNGKIDFARIKKHIASIAPYINSYLVAGSTGDGWEFDFDEYKAILDFFFSQLKPEMDFNLLIGILRTDLQGMKKNLDYALTYLQERNIKVNAGEYENSRFKGFVICPPKGKDKPYEEMKVEMESIIKLGYPIVLYQLPQITENEMHPDLVEYFGRQYTNVYMIKDSSGKDVVANDGRDYEGIILVRGAEGNYSKMLKKTGGPYDGFLLSTGNTFAKELAQIISYINNDQQNDADVLSDKITAAINEAFALVANLPSGNAFTNSNKLIDFINAFHCQYHEHPGPRLHSNNQLPVNLLDKIADILKKENLYPDQGYII